MLLNILFLFYVMEEFSWGVKGVKELSLPSVAEELRQQPWRKCLVFNFKSTKAVVLTP